MDRQSAHGGGAATATQEWLYAGAEAEPPAVDGAFFMQLLEDNGAPAAELNPAPDDADDRLSRVIRSLEAEICGGPPPAAPEDRGEHAPSEDVVPDGWLEDMLVPSSYYLHGSPGPCAAEVLPSFEYWAELPPDQGAGQVDVGSWYIDVDGVAVGAPYELREHWYYGYGDNPAAVEQVHSSLWE